MGVVLLVGVSARAGIIIPDGNPIGIDVPISVSTAASFVSGVSLTIDISGGNNGDLYGYLSYDGQIVTLLNRPGVTGSNPLGFTGSGFDVTLNDSGGLHQHHARDARSAVWRWGKLQSRRRLRSLRDGFQRSESQWDVDAVPGRRVRGRRDEHVGELGPGSQRRARADQRGVGDFRGLRRCRQAAGRMEKVSSLREFN